MKKITKNVRVDIIINYVGMVNILYKIYNVNIILIQL